MTFEKGKYYQRLAATPASSDYNKNVYCRHVDERGARLQFTYLISGEIRVFRETVPLTDRPLYREVEVYRGCIP